jgi:hypothetical protein
MAVRAAGSSHAQAAGAQILDGEIAAAKALTSLRYGEGPRVGFLGDTRCGKTEAMRRLIARYLRASGGVVIIADDKDPRRAQFAGQERRDRAELLARPVDPAGPRVIVLRGDPNNIRGGLDPEDVARVQWDLVRKGRASLGVYDEIDRAAKDGQWIAQPSLIAWSFKQGSGVGAGEFWGGQETEEIPRQAFNQSTHIIVFRCAGNPVRLLKRRNYCTGGVDKIIPQLPGDELPPAQRGYFVLLERGRPWDGFVYRFGAGGGAAQRRDTA